MLTYNERNIKIEVVITFYVFNIFHVYIINVIPRFVEAFVKDNDG